MSKFITGLKHNSGFWFRVRGYGLCVINRDKQPTLFSKRGKELRTGKWGISILKPIYSKYNAFY